MRIYFLTLSWLIAMTISTMANAATPSAKAIAKTAIVSTRVEGLSQAEGIDCAQPRFSWQLASPAHNVRQTTYRIRVASSTDKLRQGRADMWDSGTQQSDRSLYISYAGKPLASGTRCRRREPAAGQAQV